MGCKIAGLMLEVNCQTRSWRVFSAPTDADEGEVRSSYLVRADRVADYLKQAVNTADSPNAVLRAFAESLLSRSGLRGVDIMFGADRSHGLGHADEFESNLAVKLRGEYSS